MISLGLFAVGTLDLLVRSVGDTRASRSDSPSSVAMTSDSTRSFGILQFRLPCFAPPSPILTPIREKVEAGERLSLDDGLVLERPDVPLPEVGELANLVRERKNGNAAYYNINTHLNPTNVCVYRCVFCAFRSDLRDPKGYAMSDEQILARGAEAVDNGCTEMHIVGGLHHQRKYDWYLNVIRMLHEAYPELHLKAWTPVEIDWFCRLTKKTVREVLEDMVDAGLGSLPGGGAEIFHPEVRNQICEHKADSRRWFEIHRTAHELGLRSNCTMLYGHIEQPYHRIDHLHPPPRAAGRNRRLPDVHPAGVPPGQHGPRRTSRSRPA